MNKKSAIETLRDSLNESKEKPKKLTIKEMIYNDEVENYENNSPGYDGASLPHEESGEETQEIPQDNKPINKPLPSERSSDPEIMSILSNIRLAVINGLAKLAQKPETIEYDTLKKILQIVDKPIDTINKEK